MIRNYTWSTLSFYASVFLFAVSLPISEFMISLSSGLLLISFLVTGNFTEKWHQFKNQPATLLIISIFLVYLVGIIFTKDLNLAFYELQKTAFILVIPLCISLGPPIKYPLFRKILITFLATLNIASIVALFRLGFREQLGINDIWEIMFVSHIGFSLQLILGISILINELYNHWPSNKTLRNILIADIFYLIIFLFILKSLTGLVTFSVLLLIHFIFIIRRVKSRKWRQLAWIILPIMISGGTSYLGWCIYHFYDTDQVNPGELPNKTVNGNTYNHDLGNKQLENGHYLSLYVCEFELKREWEKQSGMKYDQIGASGFPVSSTLIRYMTSKGLTKDSVGFSRLLPKDIEAIKSGVSNYIYTKRFLSIYPRIYQTIWELDVYFKTGNPNFKSFAQRIEFVKAAFTSIRKHPLFGVGTGNYKKAFSDAYVTNHSQLDPQLYGSSHNQYLNYTVKFGIIGLIWILFAWIYPLFLTNKQRFYPAVMVLLILGIANFSDSNLEAHMGISFFVFFYSLFLFSETRQAENEK